MEYRIETDSIGSREVPADRYYGIQTMRAKENFDVSGVSCGIYRNYIKALGTIKKAAAMANCRIGALSERQCGAICKAADLVIDGGMDQEFIIDVFQGGGGTSTNMNVNEIIANAANEILTGEKGYAEISPNNHVNMGQSTNDVIPSAIKIALYWEMADVIEAANRLQKALEEKKEKFKDVVKLGRTCIQDALPITLGQEFGGYAAMMGRQKEKAFQAWKQCLTLPLGGTAVGTGMSALEGYHELVFEQLHKLTGVPFVQDKNLFDGLQNADVYIELSAALKSMAVGMAKIAADLRMMSSGPRAGFGEINLPATQPGSSIMPGKVNPVMPELIMQICYQVCGNDMAVTMAANAGELDLNVWEPVFIKNLFESAKLIKNGEKLFEEKCIRGITANRSVCRQYADAGLAVSTVVSSLINYKTGCEVSKKAFAENKTIKEKVLEEKILDEETANQLLDPLMLTDQERSGKLLLDAVQKNQTGL